MMLRIVCTIILVCSLPVFADQVAYVVTDFEDGTLAGADQWNKRAIAEIMDSNNLDGKSLGLHQQSQLVWHRVARNLQHTVWVLTTI